MPDERNFEERVADRLHTQPSPPPPKREIEKATDGWVRDLKDGRMECMLKAPDVRLRISGSAERVWQAVEMFEDWTGCLVTGDWKRPPRKGAKPIEGQTDIFMSQRPSEGDADE